mgnify:CR=1 FL=1
MHEPDAFNAIADKARAEALKLARGPGAREELAESPATLDLIKSLTTKAA